ncbi:response regulator [candidate division GN15 bacterium]|nr:response regulator [candidate division GN15 bacterium]
MATESKARILIVDDDRHVLQALEDLLADDYEVLLAASGLEAVDLVNDTEDLAAVVLDIKMTGIDGIETCRKIRALDTQLPVIFHTGYPGEYAEDEIDASEQPFDYVEKGRSVSALIRSVRNAVAASEARRFSDSVFDGAYGLIGRSLAMRKVFELIRKTAPRDNKVMILGETGTGKGLVARAIHAASRRVNEHFATLACNHKDPGLVESELFGHTKGAYSNVSGRVGLFEYADGGTVFLDEIGDLDITTQAKLLQVLETGEYRKIGLPDVRTTDCRMLCATHKDLQQMVGEGTFREDLYYRLRGIQIELPPLRSRREDIPLLVRRFVDRATVEQGLPAKFLHSSAIEAMVEFDWPGNVRQLLDVVESLVVLTDSDLILADDVNNFLHRAVDERLEGVGLNARMREAERTLIIQALVRTKGNAAAAAKILEIDPATLRKKIQRHGLKTALFRHPDDPVARS